METYLQGFHEEEQFSTNSLLSNVGEVMTDQLEIWDNIKIEENVSWGDNCNRNQSLVGKEDFQQLMSDWQQHVGLLNSSDTEDLVMGLDSNLDMLNIVTNNDLFDEKESPILSKALKCPPQKSIANNQTISKTITYDGKKEFLNDNFSEPFQNSQKVCGYIKTEPQIIRKVTLVSGEKEILGKNIIGLHCLNELKENPDENCQVTSTVINGKRYKIIIKPKSQKVKKLSEEKIRKTLIKKLLQSNLVTKMEPKEDEITSEMRNGNYDVPILNSDLLPSWDFASLDSEWDNQINEESLNFPITNEIEPIKKVPPLRIKIPRLKKHKKKKSLTKSDDEIDVETVSDKADAGNTLLTNYDNCIKLKEVNDNDISQAENLNIAQKFDVTSENIKSNLPKEMIERIEALKRKKSHRIPLIQAIPTKKAAKNGTRMQDAVATMNRNKLLKIVSSGDTVQLDHDYCSTSLRSPNQNKHFKKIINSEINLSEKNPKKDSGMESGDLSDASEGPNTPDSSQSIQSLPQLSNKILELQRLGDQTITKTGKAAFFHSSSDVIVNKSCSDTVRTKTVSNGNKALTNSITKLHSSSENSDRVPSNTEISNESDGKKICKNDKEFENDGSQSLLIKSQPEIAHPKKKLKLEEYLNRKNIREKEKSKEELNKFSTINENKSFQRENNKSLNCLVQNKREISTLESICNEYCETKQADENDEKRNASMEKKDNLERKSRHDRQRSSSSKEINKKKRSESRPKSRSRSRSRWRSSSNSNNSRRLDRREEHRYRRSESCEKKRRRSFWSSSLSRSSSRESSSSSDQSRRYKNSPIRYHRRSRSRSLSRVRSKSRNRGYAVRHRPTNYYYWNNSRKRSKSPIYAYSMREKQRQIEERRVIYVGRIEEGMTNAKLRERFSAFGPIIDISLHFREYGDNYGFVTYAYKGDAYDAVEHGNDDPSLPHYDLCFGGRRGFCKERYADLDGMPTSYSGFNDTPVIQNTNDSFDLLLKEAQEKLKIRKNTSKT